jgi:hypothetical protein
MKTRSLLLPPVAAAVLLSGCAATRIGRINADPSRYRNRTVRVNGTVVNSMGVIGTGGYQIQDDTGKIYVLSSRGVPNKGSRVTVTGRVQAGASIFGHSYGTAILEGNHKVHW